jgi:hypothetical protein
LVSTVGAIELSRIISASRSADCVANGQIDVQIDSTEDLRQALREIRDGQVEHDRDGLDPVRRREILGEDLQVRRRTCHEDQMDLPLGQRPRDLQPDPRSGAGHDRGASPTSKFRQAALLAWFVFGKDRRIR